MSSVQHPDANQVGERMLSFPLLALSVLLRTFLTSVRLKKKTKQNVQKLSPKMILDRTTLLHQASHRSDRLCLHLYNKKKNLFEAYI